MSDVSLFIETLKNLRIEIINDFDIPWIAQNKIKFPKIFKKAVKKVKDDSDEDEEDEEE
jgi:hypothetical protein